MIFALAEGQTTWKYDYYKEINHTNYKTYEMFNQTFDAGKPDIPLMNALLFFMTNEIREKHSLTVIEYSPELETASYHHAERMVKEDFFSHTDKYSAKRREPDDRAKLAGVSNPYIAENIAYSSFSISNSYIQTAEILIDIWMKSKGHRENILSKEALQGGAGVYFKGNEIFGVQNFQWFEKIITKNATDKLPEEIKN